MSDKAIVVVGAITAALIAGFFSFLNLVLSKEQKVSEFRQQWIDGFRGEISELTAAVFHIKWYLDAYDWDIQNQPNTNSYTVVASTLRESHETYSRNVTSLLLRINPTETDPRLAKINHDFLTSLQEVRDAFNAADFKKATEKCKPLRENSSLVLKAEWERVKQGEPLYRVSKRIALTIVVLGLIGTGIAASEWFISSHHPKNPDSTTNRLLRP